MTWCGWTTAASSCASTASTAARVVCEVVQGGPLRDRMGVTLPSKRVRLAAFTDQDRRDLAYGLAIGVDFVALSFVKRADDVVARARGVPDERGIPPR